jgi:hypothetical protein
LMLSLVALGAGTEQKRHDRGGQPDTPIARRSDDPNWIIKRPRQPSRNITWEQNVRVLASSGQDWTSSYSTGATPYGFYTKALLDLLRNDPNVKSLEAAHEILESRGYKTANATIYPPSTLRQLDSWRVGEQKPRFAILLGQLVDGHPVDDTSSNFDKSVKYDLDNLQSALQDPGLFNMPDSHIMRFENANRQDVERAMNWAREQLKNNPGAEIVVFYSGHGNTSTPKATDLEGDPIGELSGPNLTETELKKWVKEKLGFALRDPLNPAKLLFILDTCHSGAGSAL